MPDSHGIGWTESVLAHHRSVRTGDNETHSSRTNITLVSAGGATAGLTVFAHFGVEWAGFVTVIVPPGFRYPAAFLIYLGVRSES